MSKRDTTKKNHRSGDEDSQCAVFGCETEPPERYDYCDSHHLFRDRSQDEPGDQPTLNPNSNRRDG